MLTCQIITHTFSLSIIVTGNASKRRKLSGGFLLLFDSQIEGSVNSHNVQALYMETSQLPSSTMPVICPTVNQALKQATLLSCLTCGVQHQAGSSLYTLWCGMMWDGERKKKNRFELFLSSYSSLYWSGQCVHAHDEGMFSVIAHCISSGWPFDKASFFVIYWASKRAGYELKIRRAQCQNVLTHCKRRQRPLCCVCIKTRAHSPAVIFLPVFKLLYGLKNQKYKRQTSLWIMISFQFQSFYWAT